MNYLQDRKIKRKKYSSILYLVIAVVILIYFRNGLYNKLSFASNIIFHPVIILGNNIGGSMHSATAYFLSKSSLLRNNEMLKQDLNDARARVVDYEGVLAENASLKETLARKDASVPMMYSAILAKPNQSPYDTLVIDATEKLGIKVGDSVFAYGDVPIGKVVEVGATSSKVILFSNSGEKTQAIFGDNNIYLDITGRGGGNFEMNVPNDVAVKEGDDVTLPGVTPHVVAKVVKVISDPRDAFQKVLLATPVNIQELRFVEVEI